MTLVIKTNETFYILGKRYMRKIYRRFCKYVLFSLLLPPLFLSACTSISKNFELVRADTNINNQVGNQNVTNKKMFPSGAKAGTIINSTTWLLSGYDNQLWKTKNKGLSWSKVLEGKTWLSNPSFVNQNNGFVNLDHKLLRTEDGGDSWYEISELDKDLKNIFFLTENLGWAVGYTYYNDSGFYGRIWYSQDGGKEWKEQTIQELEKISKTKSRKWDIRSIYFLNENNGWAAGSGVVLYTSNGGKVWKVKNDVIGEFQNVDFVDLNTGWVTDKVFEASKFTFNGGETWGEVDFPSVQNGSSIFGVNNNQQILLDSRGYLFMSNTKESKWNEIKIRNEGWNSLIGNDAIGNTFIGKGFDGSIVCLWFHDEVTLSLVSLDNGKSWH